MCTSMPFEWIGTILTKSQPLVEDSDGKFPSFLQRPPQVCKEEQTIDRRIVPGKRSRAFAAQASKIGVGGRGLHAEEGSNYPCACKRPPLIRFSQTKPAQRFGGESCIVLENGPTRSLVGKPPQGSSFAVHEIRDYYSEKRQYITLVNVFYSAPCFTGQPGSVRAPTNCNTVAVTANTANTAIALSSATQSTV